MDNCLMFLGLIQKAGCLEVGEESVALAAENVKARCFLNALDASEGSKRRAGFLAEECRVPQIVLPYTKAELSSVIGRGRPGVLVITDIGFAARFAEKLTETDSSYFGVCEILSLKKKRADERKAARKAEQTFNSGSTVKRRSK